MEAILGIVALIGLYLLWQFLVDMWNEWSGACGRGTALATILRARKRSPWNRLA